MKSKNILNCRHSLIASFFACLLASGLAGATTLIDPTTNNGSFEYVNGAPLDGTHGQKIVGWDNEGQDIDNWTWWTDVAPIPDSIDSGTQVWSDSPPPAPAGPTGIWFGFIQPNAAIVNLTTYTIEAGDTFTFSWDHIGTRNNSHYVSLVYFDGTSVQTVPDTEVFAGDSGMTYGDTFIIPEDSPAIGYVVGLGLVNSSGNWPEVDNFVLTVTPVPEPSTAALLGTLGLFAFWKFLPRRRTAR